MKELKKEDIDIKGLIVSLYVHRSKPEALKRRNKNAERHLLRRRLVSPDFIELYYKIQSSEPLDSSVLSNLFNLLSTSDRDFLSYLVNNVKSLRESDNGRAFHIISSKFYQNIYTKIKMIEDGIKAGSTNPAMFEEATSLIKRLEESGQINKMVAVKLIRSFQTRRV